MNLINRGRTAEIFHLGGGRVVKLFHAGYPSQGIAKESRIAMALEGCGLPVPRCFGQTQCEGRSGLVYEYIEGCSLLQLLVKHPWRVWKFARAMALLHLQIHRAPVPAHSLPAQRDRLAEAIDRLTDRPDLQIKLHQRLMRLPAGDRHCHGDFHPDNILCAAQGLVAVDWMNAAYGHPASDVARTLILLKYATLPRQFAGIRRIFLSLFKQVLCRAYLRNYLAVSRLDLRLVKAWLPPVAATRLHPGHPPDERRRLLRLIERCLRREK
jgi:aminoglycoside phosphotransferase (APT) family kinase protein